MAAFTEGLKIDTEIGEALQLANSYNNLGAVHHALGNIPRALEYYAKRLQMAQIPSEKRVSSYLYRLKKE